RGLSPGCHTRRFDGSYILLSVDEARLFAGSSQIPGSKLHRNPETDLQQVRRSLANHRRLKLDVSLVFGFWCLEVLHRSHSPITKSSEPRMLTASLIMCPGKTAGNTLRFTNDGARIFSRCGVPPPLLSM